MTNKMAELGYTKENEHFCRSGCLLLDVGTPCLLKLLEIKALLIPGVNSIKDFLQNQSSKRKLQSLNSRILGQFQKDLLYPPNNGPTDEKQWDITLLSVMLKNACQLSVQEETLVNTLREIRNTVYGHKATASMNNTAFAVVQQDLDTVITQLLHEINRADFTTIMKEKMKRLRSEPLDIGPTIELLKKMFSDQHEISCQITEHVSKLSRQLSEVKEDVAKSHEEVMRQINVAKESNPPKLLQNDIEVIQNHLKTKYDECHRLVPVAPLLSKEGISISDIHTEIKLNDVTSRFKPISREAKDDNPIEIKSFRDIFHEKASNVPCQDVLMIATAGRGKSTFCLRVVETWCNALNKKKSKSLSFSVNESQMLKFYFVFFISLRCVSNVSTVLEMVCSMLLYDLHDCESMKLKLKSFFNSSPGRCLFILDGLDEWFHPQYDLPQTAQTERLLLPSRLYLNDCPIIYTSRPWRLDSLPIGKIKKVIEIDKLSDSGIKELAKNVLIHFYSIPNIPNSSKIEDKCDDFVRTLKSQSLSLVAEVPLVLTYLVCVWYEDHGLENSRTENFSGLFEQIIKAEISILDRPIADISLSGNFDFEAMKLRWKNDPHNLPGYLAFQKTCCDVATLIIKLSAIAYETIIGASDSVLVFERQQLEEKLGRGEIYLCLKLGILSLVKVPGHVTREKVIVQFFHKGIQEFLAGIYIAMKLYPSRLENLTDNLQNIQKLIQTSNAVIFACGLNPRIIGPITRNLMIVASSDEDINTYRHSLDRRYVFRNNRKRTYSVVKQLQDVVLKSLKESKLNSKYGDLTAYKQTQYNYIFHVGNAPKQIHLHDMVITEKADTELIQLGLKNSTTLKSVYIDSPPHKHKASIENILRNSASLERIELDTMFSSTFFKLSSTQLKNLRSLTLTLENVQDFPDQIGELKLLTAFSISLSANHSVIEDCCDYLRKQCSISEVELIKLTCTEHRGSYDKCSYVINLSQNRSLRRISFNKVRADSIDMHSTELEDVCLSSFVSQASMVLIRLLQSQRLTNLVVGDLRMFKTFSWDAGAVKVLAVLIARLVSLKHLHILGINFHDREVQLPPKCLETLSMEMVLMSDENWYRFVSHVASECRQSSITLAMVNIDDKSLLFVRDCQSFRNVTITTSNEESEYRYTVRFDVLN